MLKEACPYHRSPHLVQNPRHPATIKIVEKTD
jgi:hypothetical protein